jgi:hypothetical protein
MPHRREPDTAFRLSKVMTKVLETWINCHLVSRCTTNTQKERSMTGEEEKYVPNTVNDRISLKERMVYIEETEFIYIPWQVKSTKITVKTTREKQRYKQDHNEQDKSPTGRKTIQYVKVVLLY